MMRWGVRVWVRTLALRRVTSAKAERVKEAHRAEHAELAARVEHGDLALGHGASDRGAKGGGRGG